MEKAFYETPVVQAPSISRDVIRHSVWLYFRFNLSFRDVEELMAQRGIDVTYHDPVLDDQVWTADRQTIEEATLAFDGVTCP